MFLSPVAYGGVVSNLEHRPDGFCQSMLVWASCCVNRDERFVSFLLGEKPRWPWGGDLDPGNPGLCDPPKIEI